MILKDVATSLTSHWSYCAFCLSSSMIMENRSPGEFGWGSLLVLKVGFKDSQHASAIPQASANKEQPGYHGCMAFQYNSAINTIEYPLIGNEILDSYTGITDPGHRHGYIAAGVTKNRVRAVRHRGILLPPQGRARPVSRRHPRQ